MRRVVVEIDVPAADAELAGDRLWSLGATAVEERASRAGQLTLAAGIDAAAVEQVVGALPPTLRPRVVEVDDAAWADGWRRWATDVAVGERLLIHPAWLPSPVGERLLIELDPGRAFGSGTHPTTRLVLAELEARLRPGDRVLDVGSGSGVLSVAAARIGAGSVAAVDIDAEAVRSTTANAARNGVTASVHARVGDVTAVDGRYELVLVNIGAAAIIEAAGELAERTASGGLVVLSGFLADRSAAVAAAFEAIGVFDPVAETLDGEWAALVLRRGRTVRADVAP